MKYIWMIKIPIYFHFDRLIGLEDLVDDSVGHGLGSRQVEITLEIVEYLLRRLFQDDSEITQDFIIVF